MIMIFRFFVRMSAATILDFENFEFLTVGRANRLKLRQVTKFRGDRTDRSNRCWDMAIFRFFKNAAVRHLGFMTRAFGSPTKGIWWSLSLQNLVGIDVVISIICTFS